MALEITPDELRDAVKQFAEIEKRVGDRLDASSGNDPRETVVQRVMVRYGMIAMPTGQDGPEQS